MAHDVFVSYSSKDKPVADAIVAHLESRGIRCWYAPRDIQPGTDWAVSIIEALGSAKMMVLIFTDDSNESDQVLREAAYAVENGLVIVPFRLSKNKPNEKLRSYLKQTHWLNAVDKQLAQSIQELGNRCESVIGKINRQDELIADDSSRGKIGRAAKVVLVLVCVLIVAVAAYMIVSSQEAEKHMDPADSSLVATVDESLNGITRIHLSDDLTCMASFMTCDEFTQAFVDGLNEFAGPGHEAVPSEVNMGMDIYKNGQKTPFSIIFTDGNNAMIKGGKKFCTVGVTDGKDSNQDERLKVSAALIKAAYPAISAEDANELALVMYHTEGPMHAWSGIFELNCDVGAKYSFTIVNSKRYND